MPSSFAAPFASRATTPELMDTEQVPFEEFRDCLVDLSRVNRMTLTYRPTVKFFERLRQSGRWPEGRPLEVLDVGSGYGDVLRAVQRWARGAGAPLRITGVDMSPWSTRAAQEAPESNEGIDYVTADAFDYEHERPVDVVTSSQFTHHLPDALLVRFLAFMEARAGIAWFVSDLHRHPVPFHFFKRFAKLARFHRFVQHDGPVSIASAFVAEDWRSAMQRAGIDPSAATIRWEVPFRMTVERVKARG